MGRPLIAAGNSWSAGTTEDGLPVGLQLVGPHGSERRLLAAAAAFEGAAGLRDRPAV